MYTVFDSYLNVDTWHTGHAFDDQRFHIALGRVVTAPDFDPDKMGEYFRKKVGVVDENDPLEAVIRMRVRDAHAVKDYLKYNV